MVSVGMAITYCFEDSPVFIDPDDNVTIKGTVFRGVEKLWELLTRKNVNRQIVGKEDFKT